MADILFASDAWSPTLMQLIHIEMKFPLMLLWILCEFNWLSICFLRSEVCHLFHPFYRFLLSTFLLMSFSLRARRKFTFGGITFNDINQKALTKVFRTFKVTIHNHFDLIKRWKWGIMTQNTEWANNTHAHTKKHLLNTFYDIITFKMYY